MSRTWPASPPTHASAGSAVPGGRWGRLRRRATGGQDGAATLELVVLFPLLLLLIFGVVQGALYYHARAIALAAAQEGLRAAQVEDGTAAAGAARAEQFLAQAGDGLILSATVRPARSQTAASVTVRGRAPSLAPGLPGLPVAQTADGPVERLTTDAVRP